MKKNNVTKSKYWEYKNKEIKNNILINFIKNFLENIFGIKIVKKKNFNNSFEISSYPKSKNLIKVRNYYLQKKIQKFLEELKLPTKKNKILNLIIKHDKIFYKKNFIENNYGGMGFNNSLFIFIFLCHLDIDLIIESGVWKGYSTYLFDKYPKKIKKILFDINFDELKYISKSAEYCEFDITKYEFKKIKKFKKVLAFYDDHVSQYDRLKLSFEKNFSYLIFDDDLEFSAIHSDGWPSLPTLSMISSKFKLKKFEWNSINKSATANLKKFRFENILKKYRYVKAPNISKITGYYNQPQMSFLIKK